MTDMKIYDTIAKKEFIDKGWSEDKKYRITTAGETKYLLRISPIERFEARKNLFEMLERIAALGVPMCEPIEFGTCAEGVYFIQSWIDGEELGDILPTLPKTEQYLLGFKSGEILRKIHNISVSESDIQSERPDWAESFDHTTDDRIQKYHDCGASFDGDEIDKMAKQTQEILAWFDDLNNPVPSWYLKDFYVQYIDGIPCKLKEPFDFSFLKEYGKVFKIFDEQGSGCICFGVSKGKNKYFIKFAGVKTFLSAKHHPDYPVSDDVARLKASVPKYKDLAHPLLINFIEAKAVGSGYVTVFDWFDGESFGDLNLLLWEKFFSLPLNQRMKVFEDILQFHEHVAKCGYVAIDFNDNSPLYNFETGKVMICDIDFYAKQSYINGMGRGLGDQVIMAPEEFRIGGVIDEVTNVYTMGATAFRLLANSNHSPFEKANRSPEAWQLNMKLYEVVKKAVSDERSDRQQSIEQLIADWKAAK